MTTASDSLFNWLQAEIHRVLTSRSSAPQFLIWCDPDRVWKEPLRMIAEFGEFELWADEVHELLLRERFFRKPRVPRVIWLPVARELISYFKVFELQAAEVKQLSIDEALACYGVELTPRQLEQVRESLAVYVKEWMNEPRAKWEKLAANPTEEIVTVEDLQAALISQGKPIAEFISGERLSMFDRRLRQDFGLPAPSSIGKHLLTSFCTSIEHSDSWRRQAMAVLLCTDAALKCPATPPSETDRVIPAGAARNSSMKLLASLMKQIDSLDAFEGLAKHADILTALSDWAGKLESIPAPLCSPSAESALFQAEVQRIRSIHDFKELAEYLDQQLPSYREHAQGFWGRLAKSKIQWSTLDQMARSASLLLQETEVQDSWTSAPDAVGWYTNQGWKVDRAGEALFVEDAEMQDGLAAVRARLRKAYQRHLDRTNAAFSDLLSRGTEKEKDSPLTLPFAGDLIQDVVERASPKEPAAVLVLDACRFDLGCRLAEMLNQGEPVQRARISAARAPIPSITALGMPYCLPGASQKIETVLPDKAGSFWQVRMKEFSGDLAVASDRKDWLKSAFGLKDKSLLSVAAVLGTSTDMVSVKSLGRLVFVFGDEFDAEGHDGRLKLTGCDAHLDRYWQVMRRLRSGGYSTIAVVTDHGFFHWQPDEDEVETKPTGSIRWSSRRVVAGEGLNHPSALAFKATGSSIECRVPRSINAFKTYGGMGYFHGGATLQELIIPVIVAQWPKKAQKVGVVLKPISQITSLRQRVEVAAAGQFQQTLDGSADASLMSRQVVVKVFQQESGKVLFRSKVTTIEPGGEPCTLELSKAEGIAATVGTALEIRLLDADNDEVLDRKSVSLKVELDEWS